MINIVTNIKQIHNEIIAAEEKYNRKPGSVTLLAVSKTRTIDEIRAVANTGQQHFGENYLQEAILKIKSLRTKNLIWHFIGSIQSNKTKLIAENFDWVQGVDRLNIAKRLNDQRPDSLSPLNICVEVNLNNEDSKAGVALNDVLELVNAIKKMPKLHLRGLMAIPKASIDVEKQRKAFSQLYCLFKKLNEQGLGLDTLSMGMSSDFEAAIAEGSTMVRIGTAIFGSRN